MITEEYLSTLDANQAIRLLEEKIDLVKKTEKDIEFIRDYVIDKGIKWCDRCGIHSYDVPVCDYCACKNDCSIY